jgi:hypothetical protein
MVIPQKRNWYGKWIDQDYDASKHEEYAADMQEANFIDIYHSLVFFYQVYKNWIEISKDYMMEAMRKAGMTSSQTDIMAHLLSISTDGIIPVILLPPKKISELKKSLK